MSGIGGVVLFLGAAVAVWFLFGRGGASADAAIELARTGEVPIVDVRTPGEFASGHVRGAVNIPVDQLGVRIAELGTPGRVVIYCASGMRSARAARVLAAAGFEVLDAQRFGRFPADLRA
jgi:rhodanese-related sulfurtransferase